MNIGVFDSGRGGVMLAEHLEKALPDDTILLVTDTEHLPYGSRTQAEVIALTDAAIQPLLIDCRIVVIACNTATAAAIDTLRDRYPSTTFVGVEPMIKPAAAYSKTGVIAVCATPATLSSERYRRLKRAYTSDITVLEPDCSTWATMIEVDDIDTSHITSIINHLIDSNADVILLSCTHYRAIKPLIESIAGDRCTVLEPSEALAERIANIKATVRP